MPEDKLRQLAETFEGRLFLANLANQVHVGIISRERVEPFLKWARNPASDFSNYARALSSQSLENNISTFNPASLHFSAIAAERQLEDVWLMRVTNMESILRSVIFEDASIGSALENALGAAIRPGPLTTHNDDEMRDLIADHSLPEEHVLRQALPERFNIQSLIQATPREANCALTKQDKSAPKFFSFWRDGSAQMNPLCGVGPDVEDAADVFRDMLGLDFMSKYWGSNRVALGFYLVRAKNVTLRPEVRPTVFDKTSRARFRACFGSHIGTRAETGRTADLAKIADMNEKVEGVPEIVVPNEPFATEKPELLVGYLGLLSLSRDDTYSAELLATLGPENWPEADRWFLQSCFGGWDLDTVMKTLLDSK